MNANGATRKLSNSKINT